MAFAQLTYRESLRDIEACLRAVQPKWYHVGIRARVARSTFADANEHRDWRIYADFAQRCQFSRSRDPFLTGFSRAFRPDGVVFLTPFPPGA